MGLAALRQDIAEVGWVAMLVYWLHLFLSRLRLGRAVCYAMLDVDLEQVSRSSGRSFGNAFRLEKIEPGDDVLETLDVPPSVIEDRFAAGGICHILKGQKHVMSACIWHQEGRFDEDEVRASFVLPDNAVWDYGVYVPPELRAGRSLAAIWSLFASEMCTRGRTRSISRIGIHNRASLRSHKRLPHTLLGRCIFISLGRYQFSFSTLAPKFFVSSSARRAPSFDLSGSTK